MKRSLRKLTVVALFVCLTFSSASFAVTKWACVGDSITVGWKLAETDTYCYKLGVLLGSEYETTNFGHSARTMLRYPITGQPYWESPMFTASQDYNPNIVTIMLGTNDAHVNNMPALLPDYEQDYIDMVNIYKNLPSHPRVICLTVPPVKPQSDRYEGVFLVNSVIPNVAAATGTEVIDIYTALVNSGLSPQDMWKDLIHLNAPAHTVVAETIYNYITGGGPVCGDATCDPGEDQCNCPGDCGNPPLTETLCSNDVDDDCDGFTDCADSDCDGDPVCAVQSIYVNDIAMSWYQPKSGFYAARATVWIKDQNTNNISGATVSGNWSGATTGTSSGNTGSDGKVTLTSKSVKGGGTFTFTVTDVTATGYTYNPSLNIETSDSITAP